MRRPFTERQPAAASAEFSQYEKYALPFTWGALHVTEQADAAYGLLPLTAKSSDGGSERFVGAPDWIDGIAIRTDIWLVSPTEAQGEPRQPFPGAYVFYTDVRASVGPSSPSLELICNFDTTDTDVIENASNKAEAAGIELSDDAPPDVMAQTVHQAMVHVIATALEGKIALGLSQLLEDYGGKSVMSRSRKDFLIGLGGAAYLAVLESLIDGRIDDFGEAASGGLVVVGALLAHHRLRAYFENLRLQRQSIRVFSQLYASFAAKDIHQAFSTEHFNQQAERQFGPMSEDE
jgi:hypothetical protein